MAIYNTIGKNYNKTRFADERILNLIISLLESPAGKIIADIGAGTGNYSYELAKKGYFVHALEPSVKMHEQKFSHDNLLWYKGFAENIPFDDDRYDGVICTMATHHFSSLVESYKEMCRILKSGRRMVVFTADLRMACENCWLKEYFKDQFKLAGDIHPECSNIISMVESIFGTKAVITPFPLPHDLKDGFFYSAWRYPEKYLNDDFRNGISCFSLADKSVTDNAIQKLADDLKSGRWDEKYGYYRSEEFYNGGYYFLSIAK